MPYKDFGSDISAIDWSVAEDRQDQRTSYQLITDELHLVSSVYPYYIRLDEKPYETAGVTVTGFTVVTSMPTAAGETYVDYEDSRIYFHSSKAGELVKVTYYGMGSAINAADVNRFGDFLDLIRHPLITFQVEAFSPVSRKARVYGGYLVKGSTLQKLSEKVLNFGTGGGDELAAITAGYWKKLLIGVNNSSGAITVTVGSESSTENGAAIPAIPANTLPCAVITVHDDGTGTAGTIDNIEAADVEDVRTFLS